MKFNLVKTLGATLIGGTIVVSAITWNGGAILDNAKAKLTEMGSTIGIFKQNEQAMKTKILDMKDEIAELQKQIANGEGNKTELEARIAELEEMITKLNSEIEKGNNNIKELEGQLTKANEDAEALALEIENLKSENPMTQEELEALLGGVVDNEGTETPEAPKEEEGDKETGEEEVTVTYGYWDLNTINTYDSDNVDLEIVGQDLGAGMVYTLNITNKTTKEMVQQPIKIKLCCDGKTLGTTSVNKNGAMEFDANTTEIRIESNAGTLIESITVVNTNK